MPYLILTRCNLPPANPYSIYYPASSMSPAAIQELHNRRVAALDASLSTWTIFNSKDIYDFKDHVAALITNLSPHTVVQTEWELLQIAQHPAHGGDTRHLRLVLEGIFQGSCRDFEQATLHVRLYKYICDNLSQQVYCQVKRGSMGAHLLSGAGLVAALFLGRCQREFQLGMRSELAPELQLGLARLFGEVCVSGTLHRGQGLHVMHQCITQLTARFSDNKDVFTFQTACLCQFLMAVGNFLDTDVSFNRLAKYRDRVRALVHQARQNAFFIEENLLSSIAFCHMGPWSNDDWILVQVDQLSQALKKSNCMQAQGDRAAFSSTGAAFSSNSQEETEKGHGAVNSSNDADIETDSDGSSGWSFLASGNEE